MRLRNTLCTAVLVSATVNLAAGAPPATLYETNCSLCHQTAARGAPAQFPRLNGRATAIASDQRGRAYLVHVVRNGMAGTIVVDGTPLTGVMPPQAQLSPQDIAQILNYILSLSPSSPGPSPHGSSPKPFTGAEVAALSATAISADALQAERQALVAASVIP